MQNKNFDGIGSVKIVQKRRALAFKPILVDALVKVQKKKQVFLAKTKIKAQKKPRVFWLARRFRLPVLLTVILISASFAAGSWLTLKTDKTFAEDKNQLPLTDSSAQGPVIPVVAGTTALGPISQVPNEILFNLTLEQLEVYLQEALKTPEMKQAEILAKRKEKLKQYLEEKKSPFAEIVGTIAELKHWKMVLAISNSESSLGKNCYTNNCSGIGVEPGHPYWREYATKADWAKDMDKLIEKRYKDWTLEEMNGVYNHPGSANWIMASKQILEELQEENIE